MAKKVLVIDDDEALLEVLEQVLEYAGFGVKCSAWEHNFFDQIDQYKPDLVIIDYLLQGVNGGDICHQIKANPKTSFLPVILISAYPRVLHSLGSYGFDMFIAKPFDITELVDNINNCLSETQIYSTI